MAIQVVEFSGGIQNWIDFCLKIDIPEGKYCILRIGVMGRCQKVLKFDFQSQFFYVKNNRNLLKDINLGALFLKLTLLLIPWISESLYFLKWCPIFDSSPLHQLSKFKPSLWVCWFFSKNLSNFVFPTWKPDNPYCHIQGQAWTHKGCGLHSSWK